jgi:RND family efflux transporter MFP subunit
MKRFGLVVAGIFALLLIIGILPRLRAAHDLDAEGAAVHQAPPVAVVVVHQAPPVADLLLPGSLEPLHEAAIYARTTGYVTRWMTDIGAHVQAGQLMALIETPELDQQADQAKAALGQLRADSALAKANLDRWKSLYKDTVVTQQELETRDATYSDAVANLGAGLANYQRLVALRGFERVTAPFRGVVTSRGLDIGMLVTDGATLGAGGTASARPLFSIAGTDTVRVYVNVPEDVLPLVYPGEAAEVLVQAVPNGVFQGVVTRSAHALDAASRTLLTEVQVPNPKGVLLPGMYAQVHFRIQRDHPPLIIQANTLVIRPDGPQVAVVGPDHVVHFQKIELGRDYGNSVEITSGVADGASVVVNPSDDIHDGLRVRVLPSATETTEH